MRLVKDIKEELEQRELILKHAEKDFEDLKTRIINNTKWVAELKIELKNARRKSLG